MAAGVSTPQIGRERLFYDRRFLFITAGIIAFIALAILSSRFYYMFSHVTTDDAYVDAYPAVVSARATGMVVAIPVQDGQHVRRGEVIAQLDDTEARSQLYSAREQLLAAQAALAQARYDARAELLHHDAQTLQAAALNHQAAERARSLMLTALSNRKAADATRQGIVEAQAMLNAANAQIPAAKMRLQTARNMLQRMRDLNRQGLIAPTQFDAAQNDYAQAQAALQSALSTSAQARANVTAMRAKAGAASLQSYEAQASARAEQWGETLAQSDALANSADTLKARQAAVQAQQAQVDSARRALQLAQYRLSQMLLRSPVDGYVASRPAGIGQVLQTGDPAVVIMPATGLYVTANFKETQVYRIRDGAPADIHVDALPNVRFHGRVQALGGASQSAVSIAPNTQITANFVKITQRIPVRVVIDAGSLSSADLLRPGMSAEVSIAY